MIIYQGNSYELPIILKINGAKITADDVEKVEFSFGQRERDKTYTEILNKTYPDIATNDGEKFILPLTQDDTLLLPHKAETYFQARICFKDGSVKTTGHRAVNVMPSISKAVL